MPLFGSIPSIRKGLYLYGDDFVVGKSFMMAALARYITEKKTWGLSNILHYPSFVIDVKNAISEGSVKENFGG